MLESLMAQRSEKEVRNGKCKINKEIIIKNQLTIN